MLYDQGQLLRSYSNFYKTFAIKEDKEFAAKTINDIADYLNKNLSHPVSFKIYFIFLKLII